MGYESKKDSCNTGTILNYSQESHVRYHTSFSDMGHNLTFELNKIQPNLSASPTYLMFSSPMHITPNNNTTTKSPISTNRKTHIVTPSESHSPLIDTSSTQTQSKTTFPLQPPQSLKRKFTKEQIALFTKRLKNTCEAPEAAYPHTNTINFIPSSSSLRESSKTNGVSLKDCDRKLTSHLSNTTDPSKHSYSFSPVQLAEEAGLIMPPTCP